MTYSMSSGKLKPSATAAAAKVAMLVTWCDCVYVLHACLFIACSVAYVWCWSWWCRHMCQWRSAWSTTFFVNYGIFCSFLHLWRVDSLLCLFSAAALWVWTCLLFCVWNSLPPVLKENKACVLHSESTRADGQAWAVWDLFG